MRATSISLMLGSALALSACTNDYVFDANTPPTSPPSSTEQVRQIASQRDDTSAPVAVNDGAFVFTDSRETNEPARLP